MEWKSGISQIPCGMAEKRRKCGIIPPKAEWLACLSIGYTGNNMEKVTERPVDKSHLQFQGTD